MKAAKEDKPLVTLTLGQYTITFRVLAIGSTGIGAFEFWGAKGFDHGQLFVDGYEVTGISVNEKPVQADEFSRLKKLFEESPDDNMVEFLGDLIMAELDAREAEREKQLDKKFRSKLRAKYGRSWKKHYYSEF